MSVDRKQIERLMKAASMASVCVAAVIIFIKIAAWIMTDSLSLLSSLVDSILDIVSSFIGFMAVRYSLQPADEDHRFGHGKAEDIAAFAQSAFISGSGIFIIVEAIGRLVDPHPIANSVVGIAVMLLSCVLTIGLLFFQSYVIKRTKSTLIQADNVHYKSDLLINGVVILSFVVVEFFDIIYIDTILAIFIALYIFKSAWDVGRGSFDKLMDKEFSDDDRQKITEAVFACKGAKAMHDLRTRSSGIKPFIQFHLEMDGNIKLKEAHKICDEIELNILKHFPHAEVLIHQDIEGDVPVELGRVVPVRE